jgi:hypothetical protein
MPKARKVLIDDKTGFPMDQIDGKDAPSPVNGIRTIPMPPGAVIRNTDEIVFNQLCDYQMGAIVTARNRAACVGQRSTMLGGLPYHVRGGEGAD